MKIFSKQNKFHFVGEQRVLNFAGSAELQTAAQQAVETELNKQDAEGKSLKEKAKLGNLTGDELMDKVDEIATSLIKEDEDNAEKKMKKMKETLQVFAKELGISENFRYSNQIVVTRHNYQRDVAKAKEDFDARTEDFKSVDEKYGGKETDRRINSWRSKNPDDIANAPEGSETKAAYDSWMEAKTKLSAVKRKSPIDAVDKIFRNEEITKLKEEVENKLAAIETAIKADRDAPHAKQGEKIAEVFQNAFEEHQERQRDKKAITKLAGKYKGKLPEGFDTMNPNIEEFGKSKKRIGDIGKHLEGEIPDEPFKTWGDLIDGLKEDKKATFADLNEENKKGIRETFNQAILLNNAEKFLAERDAILKTESKPEEVAKKEDSAPAVVQVVGSTTTAEADPENAPPVESEVVDNNDGGETSPSPTMPGVRRANFETSAIENLSLNREAITSKELNKNGTTILNGLKGSLKEFGITEATILNDGGKGKRGLQGIVELQNFLKGKGMKGIDDKELAIDGLAGENTIYALGNYGNQRKAKAKKMSYTTV